MFYKIWTHFTVPCGADKIHLFPEHVNSARACFLAGKQCEATLSEGRCLASRHHVGSACAGGKGREHTRPRFTKNRDVEHVVFIGHTTGSVV